MFSRTLGRLETALNLLASTILFGLMFYVTAEVAMRYVFNRPLPGHLELTQLFIAPAVFLALSYVQEYRGHVGMDLLVEKLSRRRRAAVDAVVLVVALATFVVIAWFSWTSAWMSWEMGDVTPTAYLPTWWSKMAVPVGSALLCVRLALQIVDSVRVALGHEAR